LMVEDEDSGELKAIDQFDVYPAWSDGFDVHSTPVKGSTLGFSDNYIALLSSVFLMVIGVVEMFFDDTGPPHILFQTVRAIVLMMLIRLFFLTKRKWRLRGSGSELTISKAFWKFGWNRRDFKWAQIDTFGTSVGTDGYADVLVNTHEAQDSLKLKMLPDEANELVRSLTAMQVAVKMQASNRSGYRGVRVEAVAEAELELSKIDSNNNTVA
jgi:hypothetical protein